MKKTGQLIASVAIATMAMGTLGSGFLVLSATEVAAKSEKGASKSAEAGSKAKGKAHGKWRGKNAKFLKNLNSMCSNGKSTNSNESRVRELGYAYQDVLAAEGAILDAGYEVPDDLAAALILYGPGGAEEDLTYYGFLMNLDGAIYDQGEALKAAVGDARAAAYAVEGSDEANALDALLENCSKVRPDEA